MSTMKSFRMSDAAVAVLDAKRTLARQAGVELTEVEVMEGCLFSNAAQMIDDRIWFQRLAHDPRVMRMVKSALYAAAAVQLAEEIKTASGLADAEIAQQVGRLAKARVARLKK